MVKLIALIIALILAVSALIYTIYESSARTEAAKAAAQKEGCTYLGYVRDVPSVAIVNCNGVVLHKAIR